jgi:hypothetical protein
MSNAKPCWLTSTAILIFNPDNPLGGSSSLRECWRSICGHFRRLLGVHRPGYGLLSTDKTVDKTVSQPIISRPNGLSGFNFDLVPDFLIQASLVAKVIWYAAGLFLSIIINMFSVSVETIPQSAVSTLPVCNPGAGPL